MGNPRSGKTGSMVLDGYNMMLMLKEYVYNLELKKKITELERKRLDLFKSFELWSNLNLNKKIFGEYKKISVKDIIDIYYNKTAINNKIILLDDLFKEIDSRDTMRKIELPNGDKVSLSTIFSHFCLEIGKSNNILDYVTHYDGMIEKRLTPVTEFFIFCQKGHYKTLKFKEFEIKNIWVEDDNYYDLSQDKTFNETIIIKHYISKNQIDFNDKMEIKRNVVDVDFIEGKKFFNLYNTGEVI
jgi:hypothetical protein